MLKLMTEKGLLVSEGYGRGTRYVLPINGIDILIEEPSNVATLTTNVASSKDANVATSVPNVATSIKKKCLGRNCKNSYCRIAKNGFYSLDSSSSITHCISLEIRCNALLRASSITAKSSFLMFFREVIK